MAKTSISQPKPKGKGKKNKKKDFTKQDGKQIALGVANKGKKKDYAKEKCFHCGEKGHWKRNYPIFRVAKNKGFQETRKLSERELFLTLADGKRIPVIENLIRQGKLRNFLGRDHKNEKLKAKLEETSRPPLGEIRVIIEGTSTGQSSKSRKIYLKVVQNVKLSRRSLRTRTRDEQAITFTNEDAEKVYHPHDNAIVITLLIADYTTRRVLVDNGSLVDILYYPAFQQMRLGRDQLCPVNSPLVGFGGMKVQPVCTITLPVVVGAYPQQITNEVNFLVVDCSSSYNAIIERLTLNSWKVVTSTYHLSVKFPTKYGVGQAQGDQLTARECYLTMLAMDKQI
nr:uncharacterized protein LOC111987585 [Quercus suber]